MNIEKTKLFDSMLDIILNSPFELLSECNDDKKKLEIMIDVVTYFKEQYIADMFASHDDRERKYNEEIVDRLKDVEILINEKWKRII